MSKKNKLTKAKIFLKQCHSDVSKRECNICHELFAPRSTFDRYCDDCKGRSELLKFSDWLPDLDFAAENHVKIPA